MAWPDEMNIYRLSEVGERIILSTMVLNDTN